jgi:hypothetical protein
MAKAGFHPATFSLDSRRAQGWAVFSGTGMALNLFIDEPRSSNYLHLGNLRRSQIPLRVAESCTWFV